MNELSSETAQTVLELAREAGFESIGTVSTQALAVNPEVRAMCAADRCQAFGKNWMCPPACGDIDVFADRIAEHSECVVVQTVFELEDEFDFEGMMEAEQLHKERFTAFAAAVRGAATDPLLLAAGTCTLCPTCSYPDEPCRNPDRALVSMEAAGLLVSDVCTAASIPYNHGKATIAYTSCALI